jgi:hypothetical protein
MECKQPLVCNEVGIKRHFLVLKGGIIKKNNFFVLSDLKVQKFNGLKRR